MKGGEYFQEMRKTSDIVNPIIHREVETLREFSESLYDIVSELPNKRIKEPSKSRAFMLRKAYEIVGGQKWEEIAPICAAVEIEFCSMYYTNRIYDDKGHITEDRDKINSQIMAAKITRDLATRVIEGLRETIPHEKLEQILSLMNESDLILESGQYLDVFENIYPEMGDASFEDMIKSCDERIYKVNASYFEKIAMMGAILANGSKEQINALANFGKNYGMMLLIVNDIADFLPSKHGFKTSEKIPEDSYSDIKHGKLTYPIIYTLHYGKPEEKEKLIKLIEKGKGINEDELMELTKILVNNGSIDFAKKRGVWYKNRAKKSLKMFDKESRRYLSSMCVISESNRYFKELKIYENEQ